MKKNEKQFLKTLKEKISKLQSSDTEYIDFVKFLVEDRLSNNYILSDNIKDIMPDIIQSIQDRFLSSLKSGYVPHKSFINLYYLFDIYKPKPNPRFTNFINELKSENDNELEESKFISNELLFMFYILNGKAKEYIADYFVNIASFGSKYINYSSDNFTTKTFFDLQSIDEDIIYNIINRLYDYSYFSSLQIDCKKTILLNTLIIFSKIKQFYKTTFWLQFQQLWKNFSDNLIKDEDIDISLQAGFVFLSILKDSIRDQKGLKALTDDFEMPLSKFYKNYGIKNNLPQYTKRKKEKKSIAIIKKNIVSDDRFYIDYSILKNIMEQKSFTDKFDVIVISLDHTEIEEDNISFGDYLNSFGIEVLNPSKQLVSKDIFTSYLQKAMKIREFLLDRHVDIIINTEDSCPISNFLFSTRVAKKQIYWAYNNFQWNINEIDKRVSHYEIKNDFKYDIFPLVVNKNLLTPEIPSDLIQEEKDNLSKNCTILGTIGKLINKHDTDHIKMISRLLKKHQNTIYVICGDTNIINIQNIFDKDVLNRIYFIDKSKHMIYHHIIDILLIQFSSTNEKLRWEFIAKNEGQPFVALNREEFMNIDSFVKLGCKKDMIPILNTKQEYENFVSKLIEDDDFKNQVSDICFNYINSFEDNKILDFIYLITN